MRRGTAGKGAEEANPGETDHALNDDPGRPATGTDLGMIEMSVLSRNGDNVAGHWARRYFFHAMLSQCYIVWAGLAWCRHLSFALAVLSLLCGKSKSRGPHRRDFE